MREFNLNAFTCTCSCKLSMSLLCIIYALYDKWLLRTYWHYVVASSSLWLLPLLHSLGWTDECLVGWSGFNGILCTQVASGMCLRQTDDVTIGSQLVISNNSLLEELESTCRFLAAVKRRQLQYFGHVVRADNLCKYVLRVLRGIVAGKRRRGWPRRRYQAMDRNTRCRVCSARKGQKRVDSLGVRVSDLRSSVMRMDLGKARQVIFCRCFIAMTSVSPASVQLIGTCQGHAVMSSNVFVLVSGFRNRQIE